MSSHTIQGWKISSLFSVQNEPKWGYVLIHYEYAACISERIGKLSYSIRDFWLSRMNEMADGEISAVECQWLTNCVCVCTLLGDMRSFYWPNSRPFWKDGDKFFMRWLATVNLRYPESQYSKSARWMNAPDVRCALIVDMCLVSPCTSVGFSECWSSLIWYPVVFWILIIFVWGWTTRTGTKNGATLSDFPSYKCPLCRCFSGHHIPLINIINGLLDWGAQQFLLFVRIIVFLA